jgi:Cu2+-exporting ATPase
VPTLVEPLLRQAPAVEPRRTKLGPSSAHDHGEREAGCLHCGLPVDRDGDAFCCVGCRLVHALIRRENLDRYYALRAGSGQPVTVTSGARSHSWLEPIEERLTRDEGLSRVDLDVQGLHCAACVWLIDQVFQRHVDAAQIVVNPALGRLRLTVGPGFPLRRFVEHIEQFGYCLGPPHKEARSTSSGLALRMGLAIALAMNAMLFAIAIYAGLHDGPLFELFHGLSFALALISVLVGGPVFFRSAWQGLRRGILHLDVPIALGILLAFGTSTWAFATSRPGAVYFDTLSIFIALMLVGRFLQERVIEKNRRYLLADDGVRGLLSRRIEGERVALVACTAIAEGDRLLIAPGDLVPVRASLSDARASFSLDWINGESEPVAFDKDDLVPAGAFLAGSSAVMLRAAEPFERSALIELLRAPIARAGDGPRMTRFWQRFAGLYVVGVLLAATLGFAVGWARTGNVAASLEIVTAVLIVTCPCALGIAAPLAYELVQNGLRRAGLFVRAPGFLDRAPDVRRVVFDKTGTLTTGALRVANPAVVASLDADSRLALYNLVARSTHPKSMAIRGLLDGPDDRLLDGAVVTEQAGHGLSLVWNHRTFRLGSRAFADPRAREGSGAPDTSGAPADGDVALSVDGHPLAVFVTKEELRPDAAAEVRRLVADGHEVWISSGDAEARAVEIARLCGIPEERVRAGQSPSDKAAFVRELDRRDTLMVGDGINDSLVVADAFCSGTPAIDRPFMAARSDFYFVTPGLRNIRLALTASRELARALRRNWVFAVLYNVLAVALAYAGLMSPLLCAVLMPLSSITTLSMTFASLSGRRPLWRS